MSLALPVLSFVFNFDFITVLSLHFTSSTSKEVSMRWYIHTSTLSSENSINENAIESHNTCCTKWAWNVYYDVFLIYMISIEILWHHGYTCNFMVNVDSEYSWRYGSGFQLISFLCFWSSVSYWNSPSDFVLIFH